MNNEELKKKIVKVLQELRASKPIVPNDYGLQIISCTTDREIADALIASVIGDVKDLQAQVDSLEITNIALQAGYDDAEKDRLYWVDKYKEAEHRAEVAELVVKNLNDIFTFDYQIVFEQAEKELEEENNAKNQRE